MSDCRSRSSFGLAKSQKRSVSAKAASISISRGRTAKDDDGGLPGFVACRLQREGGREGRYDFCRQRSELTHAATKNRQVKGTKEQPETEVNLQFSTFFLPPFPFESSPLPRSSFLLCGDKYQFAAPILLFGQTSRRRTSLASRAARSTAHSGLGSLINRMLGHILPPIFVRIKE